MRHSILLLGCLALMLPRAAAATLHNGTINGDVSQATTCAVFSSSEILGSVTYDDVTGVFSWSYRYGDNAPGYDNGALSMGGSETMAHFHGPAPPGLRAGIRVFLSTGTPNSGSTTISRAHPSELLDELWYLNIHSTYCLSGELRAQVLFPAALPSASPSSVIGLALGLLGVAFFALRRAVEARA